MGRMFSARVEAVGVTVIQDLFSLASPTSGVGVLHQIDLSQSTETGDAAEEMLILRIVTGNTTVGNTGGTAPTAIPFQLGDTPTVTVRANDTVEVSAGTQVIKYSTAWNVRVPWLYIPTPETRINFGELAAGTTTFLALQLITTPADSVSITGTIIWEEVLG